MNYQYPIEKQNKVRQLREKGLYDKETVHRILDSALVAHVAFVEEGAPVVVPMIYGRDGETLYLHGARKARVIRLLEETGRACLNVTLVDGIVFARSAFNSSMNYRSATVFGTPRLVEDDAGKIHALKIISEHTMPGRWDELRAPLEREIKMTGVIALDIETGSAKISSGMPDDEDEDYEIPIWAGVLPVESRLMELQVDDRVLDGVSLSANLKKLENQLI
jgi:nitroimidazol reductase NimA-like FMN-containing flavoprotein (pyridoxamine 5'-phosphate oxidase superfamily)